MTLSFSLGATEKAGVVRGFVWNTLEHGYRPVTVIHDIAEGDLISVNIWLVENYSQVQYVRLRDGTLEDPGCLTVFEAAEAALTFNV